MYQIVCYIWLRTIQKLVSFDNIFASKHLTTSLPLQNPCYHHGSTCYQQQSRKFHEYYKPFSVSGVILMFNEMNCGFKLP